MAQHSLGVEHGTWEVGERDAWVPFNLAPHAPLQTLFWGARKGELGEGVECGAKVAPAKRTLPHPWKQGGWSTGIASWGADSSLASDTDSLCDLGALLRYSGLVLGLWSGVSVCVCVCVGKEVEI